MIRAICLVFSGLVALAASAQEKSEVPADPLAATILERIGYDKRDVCLMAGVASQKTRVIFACTREGGPAALDRDSIFELGSLSTVFAGLLLADMVRKGEVALDDPASKYSLPGARLPTRDGREITLRHLITHTASLPAMPPGLAPEEFLRRAMPGDPAPLYEALARVQLDRPIGAEVAYSPLGFLWLSDLLARRAGNPYEELVRERVLEPLGMRDTAVMLSAEQAKRRVQGHDRGYKPVPPLEFPPSLAGAAGYNASLDDLLKLAEALAGRRKTPLDETIELAVSPLYVVSATARIGYAWFLSQRPGGRIIFQDGRAPGAYAAIAVNTQTRTASVVLADAPTDFDDLALHLVDPKGPLKRLPKTLP
jgi:D-alanyl-D-alanine-carboxypeptidase/D-alanyl-D-alanine-endopeptidase